VDVSAPAEVIRISAPPTPDCYRHRNWCRVIYQDRMPVAVYCCICDAWSDLIAVLEAWKRGLTMSSLHRYVPCEDPEHQTKHCGEKLPDLSECGRMEITHPIYAPWTDEQVRNINAWQKSGKIHPFTCGVCRADLVATTQGWKCNTRNCNYAQTWALGLMGTPV
jgi:hypothetical protein